MKVSDIIKVNCIDLNYNGLGVSKVDDFIVFVDGLLVGEVAEVKITRITKNYANAEIIKLIETSDDRVKPICPVFGICGGCDIMHLRYDAQLEFKKKSTNETLKRLGNVDYVVEKIVGMEDPYYYRNKVQVPFQMRNGKVICGFYQKGTHEVVPFEKCFIQPSTSTDIAIFIKDLANEYGIKAYEEKTKKGNIRHVLIRNTADEDYMVVIITNEDILPKKEEIVKKIKNKFPNVKSIIQNINNKKTNVILGDKTNLLFGTLTLFERLMGLKFILSYRSFFQTNHVQTEKLYSKVLEYASPTKEDVIVDGYCGIGTISLMLAQHAKKVYGIEIVKDAVKDAKDNARINDVENVEFILGKTEEEIINMKDIDIDIIVVDPPRKVCDKQLLDSIKEKRIKKIVYVSCNDATLARDLEILDESYEIKDITLYDMFPHSSHVETITLLERR